MSTPRIEDRRRTDQGRVLGSLNGRRGPLVAVVAGIHGNEPAGIEAFRNVLARLWQRREDFRGQLLGLAGNLRALEAGRREGDVDLNRHWRFSEVLAASGRPYRIAEDRERCELLLSLAEFSASRGQPLNVLDLHSTSAPGPPFCVLGDTLRNRRLAFALPIPKVLGLEEAVRGTMIEFISRHGHVALGVEGGQHEDPRTVRTLETVLMLALLRLRCVPPAAFEDLDERRRDLAEAVGRLPPVLEVFHREALEPGNSFRMRPGYVGFQTVERGEVLAERRGEEVSAPRRARILMPLYQPEGEDGFFLVRRVRRGWLGLAALLRRVGLPRLLPWLPGVRRDPQEPDVLLVHRGRARFARRKIFHLMGFRRQEGRGRYVAYVRRHPEFLAPLPLPRPCPRRPSCEADEPDAAPAG